MENGAKQMANGYHATKAECEAMADLVAIVRATRASANALASMTKHALEAGDACNTLSRNYRLVATGRLSAGAAEIGNGIAQDRKDAATRAYKRASNAYARAQAILNAVGMLPERLTDHRKES